MLGLVYIEQMFHELLGSSHTGASVELHVDVKAAISDFVREMIKSDGARVWSKTVVPTRQLDLGSHQMIDPEEYLDDKTYSCLILVWHIATCFCELARQHEQCTGNDDGGDKEAATTVVEKNHRVATLLSRYCAYLVASVPRLLPGHFMDTKNAYNMVAKKVGELVRGAEDDKLASMERAIEMEVLCTVKDELYVIEKKRTTASEWLHEVKDVLGTLGGQEAEAGIEVLEGMIQKLCGMHLMLSSPPLSRLPKFPVELDAVERSMERRQKQALLRVNGAKSSSGAVADMEKEMELVCQVKHELRAIEWATMTERDALEELVMYLGVKGDEAIRLGWRWGWESAQRLLTSLEEDMERVTQAVRGARDNLRLMKKERKRRGIRRCPTKNASDGDLILWSGLDLADRLQREPAPERWKLLADFWVKALVYAAPSDNVEEHMQHLAQGGEFITHLWALLSHHGILSWQQQEETYRSSWRAQEPPGTTWIYTGEHCHQPRPSPRDVAEMLFSDSDSDQDT